jgi:DNA-binding transcriptional LysR family regulator
LAITADFLWARSSSNRTSFIVNWMVQNENGFGKNPLSTCNVSVSRDVEQMRMGVLEHLGIAQAPAWFFAAELREGTVLRLLSRFERTVPILAVRPASRRLSTKVRIFIEHLEKTFALCSQFNPPS